MWMSSLRAGARQTFASLRVRNFRLFRDIHYTSVGPNGSPGKVVQLGPDQYFVLGNHPRSWDGRYEGPIPGSLIASTVQPFWTKQ